MGELLARGELAAAIGVAVDHADVVPLIPDSTEAGLRALRERGHYPINHLVVVRDDLLDAHPDLARAVFDAFEQAKDAYVAGWAARAAARAGARRPRRADPLPYGVEPNRAVIEELLDHAVAQRILRRRPSVEELFFPV